MRRIEYVHHDVRMVADERTKEANEILCLEILGKRFGLREGTLIPRFEEWLAALERDRPLGTTPEWVDRLMPARNISGGIRRCVERQHESDELYTRWRTAADRLRDLELGCGGGHCATLYFCA
jgi:hypothetical protein